jgi:FkbM family methyltransferase
VPNIAVRIPHIEQRKRLTVRCREHLGLIVKGAKAYERKYVDALRALIEVDQTVFDVGANIGFYSVLFSSWVGPRGRVIAYEPDPSNLDLLQRNLRLNNCENVVVRPAALTTKRGTEAFSIDRVTRLTGHLGAGATFGATTFGAGKEDLMTVPTSSLDDEVKEFGAPAVIKMDIEGGEYNALAGGAELLANRRPIIVSEMNSWFDERASGAERDPQAARFLLEHGYSLWDLDSGEEAQPDAIPWMVVGVPNEMANVVDIPGILAHA